MAWIAGTGIQAAIRPSSDFYELEATIALCGGIEGPGPASLPPLLIPQGWEMLFDSPVIGDFFNKWQLWKSPGGRYAIVIRGTVADKLTSILEDVLAVMIPGSGSVPVAGGRLPYRFAGDSKAAVHLGFAMGALLLLLDAQSGILAKLQEIVPAGADLIVTGHSQGAAIATLVRAYLDFEMALGHVSRYFVKTYLWAQPKPGNDHFAREFEMLGDCFRITNSEDWVPQLPLSIQLLDSLNIPNPISVLPPEWIMIGFKVGLAQIEKFLHQIHLAKWVPQVAKLTPDKIFPPAAKTVIPAAPGPLVDLAGGFNFEPAGIPITLLGRPGLDPANPSDSWWQHHAAMYADLLRPV